MHFTQTLELFPEQRVTQMLFKDVKNAAELRQSAVEGKINAALINPTMVRTDEQRKDAPLLCGLIHTASVCSW